jgi:predicted anti-sigma-YlaC factor YlaD
MLTPVPPTDCARAREAASARLDGELSELELAFLDSHLAACPGCSAWAADSAAFSTALRAASLEQPMRAIEFPLRRPAYRRIAAARRAAAVSAAAAALVVAVLSVHVGSRSLTAASSPVTVRTKLTLKDAQLGALDAEAAQSQSRPRPSLPAGVSPTL